MNNLILLFHDIGQEWNSKYDSITLKSFKRFILKLNLFYKIIPLNEMSRKKEKSGYCSITFDDGRIGVLDALNWLEERKIPSSVFINSDYYTTNYFWRDAVNNIIKENKIHDFNSKYNYSFKNFYKESKNHINQNGLWHDIKNYSLNNNLYNCNDFIPLNELNNLKYVRVGNHTSRHLKLNNLDIENIINEINNGKVFIEKNIKNIDDSLSIPFGGSEILTADVLNAIESCNYQSILLTSKNSTSNFYTTKKMKCIERILPLNRSFERVMISNFKNSF